MLASSTRSSWCVWLTSCPTRNTTRTFRTDPASLAQEFLMAALACELVTALHTNISRYGNEDAS